MSRAAPRRGRHSAPVHAPRLRPPNREPSKPSSPLRCSPWRRGPPPTTTRPMIQPTEPSAGSFCSCDDCVRGYDRGGDEIAWAHESSRALIGPSSLVRKASLERHPITRVPHRNSGIRRARISGLLAVLSGCRPPPNPRRNVALTADNEGDAIEVREEPLRSRCRSSSPGPQRNPGNP